MATNSSLFEQKDLAEMFVKDLLADTTEIELAYIIEKDGSPCFRLKRFRKMQGGVYGWQMGSIDTQLRNI